MEYIGHTDLISDKACYSHFITMNDIILATFGSYSFNICPLLPMDSPVFTRPFVVRQVSALYGRMILILELKRCSFVSSKIFPSPVVGLANPRSYVSLIASVLMTMLDRYVNKDTSARLVSLTGSLLLVLLGLSTCGTEVLMRGDSNH